MSRRSRPGIFGGIYSVDLGYALYNEPGVTRAPGREWIKSAMFYVKPVWRCVCIYEKKASKDLSDNIFSDPIVSVYYKTLYVRYINGQRITKTVAPVLGEKAGHNGHVVYSLDFQVTPHQLRHTYITNLIYASVDPKTVQYLAGHENSKVTMDIYAKVKYNRPEQLLGIVNSAFGQAT